MGVDPANIRSHLNLLLGLTIGGAIDEIPLGRSYDVADRGRSRYTSVAGLGRQLSYLTCLLAVRLLISSGPCA
jgi:hypothetical protein